MNRSRAAAFTLVEIVLAIAIALIVLAIAIPTMATMFTGKALEESFTDFDHFVQKARAKTLAERRSYVLIWHKEGITLEPETPSAEDAEGDVETFSFGEAKVSIERVVALADKPLAEWPFWKSGTCEPVRIFYESGEGTWLAEYDALTARGHLLEMNPK